MPDDRIVGQSYGVRRGAHGCGASGLHWVIEPPPGEATHCPCGTVSRVVDKYRYCMPRNEFGFGTCYCGKCPHYTPVPPVNYRAAIARMAEEKREKERRRRAELDRLSGQRNYRRRGR